MEQEQKKTRANPKFTLDFLKCNLNFPTPYPFLLSHLEPVLSLENCDEALRGRRSSLTHDIARVVPAESLQ